MLKYICARGETLALPLENMDAAAFDAAVVTMRRRVQGKPSGDAIGPFTRESRESMGEGLGPGWIFRLGPTETAALGAGEYLAAARLEIGDIVEITDPVLIVIEDTPA